jgi:UDP-glucose 4-epimerase
MASRGSVIPLFIQQIKDGKTLTVTDPKMTRFLMSLEDSVDLVLHAFDHGKNGDIFVQKAPASTIVDLAEAIIKIFNKNTRIDFIGTRHGEKQYESLVSREEMVSAIDIGRYYCLPADNRALNYNKYFSEGSHKISQMEDYTSHNTHRLDVKGVIELLTKLDFIREHAKL